MQVFSALARKLMNEEFRHNLLRAETVGAVTAYLREELGAAVGKSSEAQARQPSAQPQTP
jgi:hypothetical protein